MKKKLISLAVAGALATPMAVSAHGTSVTMFGSVQAEYATVDYDGLPVKRSLVMTPAVQDGVCMLLNNSVAD